MRATLAIAFAAAAAVAPASARADGLPVLGVDVGPTGVAGNGVRYVALPAPRATLVARVRLADGRIERFRYLRGRYTIPAVAYDGSADGLSADGKTLVLIEPRARFPRSGTRLAIVDPASLRLRGTVRLRGDFSFDAISPDGRTIYLIRYLSPRDPTVYEVRAYDVHRDRLLARPIVDPYASGDEMRGNPVTREASRDGHWAYTLYDGAGGHPFVHALDTVRRTARCIDLHLLAGRNDVGALRLALAGPTLAVELRGEPLALIDTRTFRVRDPARRGSAPPPAASAVPPRWLAVGGLALLAALGAGSLLVRRRRDGEAPLGGASR